MPKMTELCRRFEAWLKKHHPAGLATLKPGATDKKITKHEQATGFKLPDDVRTWFLWRDGQKQYSDESVLFGYELLSLKDSVAAWEFWQTVADMNEEIAESSTSQPADAIIAAYSLPGWIPLARSPGSSNYLGIDFNPGPKGVRGQVINFGRDEQSKYVAGRSFVDFLEFVVAELESGRVIVDEGGCIIDTFFYADIYGTPMHFVGILPTLHRFGKFDGRRLHVDGSMDRIVPLPPERGEKLRRLHDAALNDEIDDVRAILDADPGLAEYRDPWGSTLLHLAASAHSVRLLDYLSRFRLNPTTKNDRGETPVMNCEQAVELKSAFGSVSGEETTRFKQTLARLRKMGKAST